MIDSGDVEGAANCCSEAAAHFSAKGKEKQAMSWAAEAFRQYKAARQYNRCLELLDSTSGLSEVLKNSSGGDPSEEVAHYVMMTAEANGDTEGALAASRYVRDIQVRLRLLKKSGMWIEVAKMTKDDAEAAEVLMMHVGYAEAADRLLAAVKERGKATAREAKLLCQCAIALADCKLMKPAFVIVRSSELAPRIAGPLAAGLALEIAESLVGYKNGSFILQGNVSASADLKTIARDMVVSMLTSLKADLSNWKDPRKRARAVDGNTWPDVKSCEELERLWTQSNRYLTALTDIRVEYRYAFALAQLALAEWSIHGGKLGILRAGGFGEALRTQVPKQYRQTVGLLSAKSNSSSLYATIDCLRWLHQTIRNPHSVQRPPPPTTLGLLEDLQHEFAISDSSGVNGRLFSGSYGGYSGSERFLCIPAFDQRFMRIMEDMQKSREEVGCGPPPGLSSAPIRDSSEDILRVTEVEAKRVMVFYLFSMIMPVYKGLDLPPIPLNAHREAQLPMLENLLAMLKIHYLVDELISIAQNALPWIEKVVAKKSQPSLGKDREREVWQAAFRLLFPPLGSSEQNIEELVQAFPRLLSKGGVNQWRLVNFAAAPLKETFESEAAFDTVRYPDIVFTKWRVDTCCLIGGEREDARKQLTLRALKTATKTISKVRL